MGVSVVGAGSYRLAGHGPVEGLGNRWLAHLEGRRFSAKTIRAYAFDLVNFDRFLSERALELGEVTAMDLFAWLEWQARPVSSRGRRVVRLAERHGAAAATMNRRIAAVRGMFEYAVMCGERETNPVPSPRRSGGMRAGRQGLLGHAQGRRPAAVRRLVRQDRPLPESLTGEEVGVFLGDLGTHRDRAICLVMLLGGLRSAEVRSLRLADIDMGMRQVRVVGKGGKERIVPVDKDFFAELSRYLRSERPAGLRTAECFVVLRGPTAGRAMTEAGLRRIFRTHRARTGATRVRPHRLRHTFGTEMAAAGMDLLVLRDLMGHAHAETTAGYVHPDMATLSAEWSKATGKARR